MADSAAKTSEHFAGVDPEYAVYTNDVDKPYPISSEPEPEPEPEKEPEKGSDGDDSKADQPGATEPKATSRQPKK